MNELAQNKCEACSGLTPRSTADEIAQYRTQLPGWEVVNLPGGKSGHHILKKWKFKNFAEVLERVNAIGVKAEEEGHHPDIKFGWGYLEVSMFTHEINGLSKNDFILAAKIDTLG